MWAAGASLTCPRRRRLQMAAPDQCLPALITMGVSHFAEKARWALQRYAIPYREEVHVPGFFLGHRAAAKAAGGRGSVPCLRLPPPPANAGRSGQPCIDESTPILRWVDSQVQPSSSAAAADEQQQPQQQQQPPPPLFPPGSCGEEVERLCRQFDKQLGPASRVWAYSHLLYTPAIAHAMLAPPAEGAVAPLIERVVMRCGGWLLMRPLMAKGMGITPEAGAAALQSIHRVFDRVDGLLSDGRCYLVGDQFTAADLTFAALAAPAVGQAYGSAPGLSPDTPVAMRREVEELRARPAGRFVLRMWEEERGVVLARPDASGTAGGPAAEVDCRL